MRVLDLGGTPASWRAAPVRPAQVTVVNIDPGVAGDPEPDVQFLAADACQLPALLPGVEFDLVYSNSLLEHLGGHANRARLAEVVAASASHHWIQTPYRYFPVEPHWLFPGMQWLPFQVRVQISQRWPYGHIRPGGRAKAIRDVAEVELLSATEMRAYFPESDLWFERFAGLPKSLVARK
ncbi:class I SAM-dependent methyltransferase [Streptomyces coryli]|nr:class I SAM-dependent methyltransferase [Streptomyces coryli]